MIIRPARKRRDVVRPAVLLDEGRARSLDDGKVHDLARLPKGLRVYASWDDADALAQAGHGELVAWGDEPIRWRAHRHGDSHVRLSDVCIVKLDAGTRREFEHGIAAWIDWLADHETNPGWSLGGSSMSLLRRSLRDDLVTTLGNLPPPRWTLGGRQECFVERGTVVTGAVQLDLPAAYTHVIGGLRYGGAWRHAEPGIDHHRWARSGYPVLVRARVRLPRGGILAGPLAQRPRRRPQSGVEEIAPTVRYPCEGTLSGIWTHDEVEQARIAGAAVRIVDAWIHAGGDRVFADWHDAIMEGRSLPGFGGQLAKATGNALWGQFVIDDRKRLQVQRWNGSYKSFPVQGSRGHQLRAWDVGEVVCGTVRAKLFEALHRFQNSLICCHTDGLWVRDDTDQGIGEPWRLKTDARILEVLDQQKYRYTERRGRIPKVVFSGVPQARAAEVFQRLWQQHA